MILTDFLDAFSKRHNTSMIAFLAYNVVNVVRYPGINNNATFVSYDDMTVNQTLAWNDTGPSQEGEGTCESQGEEWRMCLMRQVGHGIVIPILAGVGMILNLLSLIVFTRGKLLESSYTYLTGMALADFTSLFLFFCNGIGRGHFPGRYGWRVFEAYVYFPIGLISTMASVMLTVTVSVERYIFIHDISASKRWCNQRVARRAMVVIWVVSVILNSPRYFALKVHANGTLCYSDFGKSETFARLSWFYFIVGSVIPGVALTVLSILLIHGVHQTNRRKKNMVSRHSKTHYKDRQDENRLTRTLISIVFVYLIGEIPSAFLSRNIVVPLMGGGREDILETLGYKVAALVATILVVGQLSLNFVVYSVFNHRFRVVLRHHISACMIRHVSGQATCDELKSHQSLQDMHQTVSLNNMTTLPNQSLPTTTLKTVANEWPSASVS